MKTEIRLHIRAQPDDESCGPTCLHAVYSHFEGTTPPLGQLSKQIARLLSGGTLAEVLACHALERGYKATIYTWHLQMFDPTWFADDGEAHDREDLAERLDQQLKAKRNDRRLKIATHWCQKFLKLGGSLKMCDLTASLIRGYLNRGVPLITGLSSTYLYQSSRELSTTQIDDDIHGVPQGHFVMLVGYDTEAREILVADPLSPNPPFHTAKYRLSVDRLLNAIMLGILTYDANLLVIEPPDGGEDETGARPKTRAGATKKPKKAR